MSKKLLSIHSHCSKSKLVLAIQFLMLGEALAAPIGGEIVGGAGTITQHGTETAIVQDTERLAIDWQNFDVGKGERVTFMQPGQNAIALNRILSDNGSKILGQIDANGHVILVNPQGVVFKEGAVVNAGGLIASGLQINPEDFMNGNLIFQHLEGTDGTVINSGTINAAAGGNVALIGKQVENRGLISAHLSTVALSSGKGTVLTFDHAGLLSVKVNEEILQSELGDKAAVINAGQIQAEGGRVLLSANTTRDVFSQAVNWGDRQQARSVTYNDDGSFTLGAGGDVVNSGDITVSGKTAGDVVVLGENITHSGAIKANAVQGRGGNIELHANTTTKVIGDGLITANAEQGGDIKLLGENVGLFDKAAVAVTGEKGGGRILLGGDQEGLNPQIRNAEFAYISENSNIDASATDAGDGGVAIIFAEDTARVYGNLSAKGGATGGDGGFVETSGKRGFSVKNAPNVSAANGRWGHWLIDPNTITVTSDGELLDENGEFISQSDSKVSGQDIVAVLSGGGDVTLTTGESGGDIIIDSEITVNPTESSTLILRAGNNIQFKANINAKEGGLLNIHAHANRSGGEGNILFGGVRTINTNGGDFVIGELKEDGSLDSNIVGTINVDFSGVSINTDSSAGAGRVFVNAGGKVTLGNMPIFNEDGNYADLTILTKQLNFYQWQTHLNGKNIQLEAAEWRVGDKKDLSELELKGHAGGNITLTVSESDLSENDFSGMRLATHDEGSIILDFSFTSSESLNEFKLPRLNSSADITLKGVTTDEKGFVLVNEEEKNSWDSPSWREFSLEGLLRLELGENGSATIGNIVGAQSLAIKNGNDIDLKTNGSIYLGKVDVEGGFSLDVNDGDISQVENSQDEKINVVGDASFTSNNVNLRNINNSFGETVYIGGPAESVVLKAAGDLKLGYLEGEIQLGSLELESENGDIRQDGALIVSGETALSANNIFLNVNGNNFNKIVISKAESAEVSDSENLELGSANVTETLTLSGIKNLTQSDVLAVGELSLNVSEHTALIADANSIGKLSGSVKTGTINVSGPLVLGGFTIESGSHPDPFELKLSGKESKLSQFENTTFTVKSNATVNAEQVIIGEEVRLNNASLTIDNVKNFSLIGDVQGYSSGDSFIVNGVTNAESTYEIVANANWHNTQFHINGGGQGVLKGPDLKADWIFKADEPHQLSVGNRQLSFEAMYQLNGGSATDTLDYSQSGKESITLWELPYISAIENMEVVKGRGDQILQAPMTARSIWTIRKDGGAINTFEETTIEELNGEVMEPKKVVVDRDIAFQGFTTLKGGSGDDAFEVQLDEEDSIGQALEYELRGGEGDDSLLVTGGENGWVGAYGVDQNSVPGFTFSFSGEERIKVDYKEIEKINLTAGLDEMTVWGESPGDRIQLGNHWWRLSDFEAVNYTDGLQKLTVKGGGGSISLVRKENGADSPDDTDEPLPIEIINFPNELEIVGGSLEFDEGVLLKTGDLHFNGVSAGIGSKEAPLDISVDTLKLTDNTENLYLREENGLALAGVVNGGLVDLVVLKGVLSQNDAISTGEEGQLIFKAVTGAIQLDHESNSIDVPITLVAATTASLRTSDDLQLEKVEAQDLALNAGGKIESTGPIIVHGKAQFESGDGININNAGNRLNAVGISAGGDVEVANQDRISVYEARIGGGLTLKSLIIEFLGLVSAGTLTIESADNLGGELNPERRDRVTVLVKSPVVIQDVAEFKNALVIGSELVHSASGKVFGVRRFTPADQMIELEGLAEIDPAIFTNVKNYVYQDVSILLPSDQLYGELMEGEGF